MKKLDNDLNKRERGESFIGSKESSPAPIIKTEDEKRINAQQAYLFKKGDDAYDTALGAVKDMQVINEKGLELVN